MAVEPQRVGWWDDDREWEGPWTVLRRIDSGRLWMYPYGVGELMLQRHPKDWELVLTDDDSKSLAQMVRLANHEINQELKE